MGVTHLQLDGQWATCPAPAACDLIFHFPGTTPTAMAAFAAAPLLELLNVIDPPTLVDSGQTRNWLKPGTLTLHRDYDLPAAIDADGTLRWYRHGKEHRGVGPAIMWPDGRVMYLRDGQNVTRYVELAQSAIPR